MPTTKPSRTNRAARRKDAAQTRSARKHNEAVRKHPELHPAPKRGGILGWLRSLFEKER